MKKFFSKIVLFIFVFTLEVRVKASSDLIDEPENCWSQSLKICAVKSNAHKLNLKYDGAQLGLSAQTILLRELVDQQKKLHLVKGSLLVKAKSDITLSTEFGDIVMSTGSFLVVRQNNVVDVTAMTGAARLLLRGQEREVALGAGQILSFTEIDGSGKSKLSFLRAAYLKTTLLTWRSIHSGTRESFLKEAISFKKLNSSSIEKMSEIYVETIQRRMASDNSLKKSRARQRAMRAQEKKELEKLLRQKTYSH